MRTTVEAAWLAWQTAEPLDVTFIVWAATVMVVVVISAAVRAFRKWRDSDPDWSHEGRQARW